MSQLELKILTRCRRQRKRELVLSPLIVEAICLLTSLAWEKKSLKIRQAITMSLTDLGITASTMYHNYQDAIRGNIRPQCNWTRIQMATGSIRPARVPGTAPAEPIKPGWRSTLGFVSGAICIGFSAYQLYESGQNFFDLSDEGKARFIVITIRTSLLTLAMVPPVFRAGAANAKALWKLARGNPAQQKQAGIYTTARMKAAFFQPINVDGIELEVLAAQENGRPRRNAVDLTRLQDQKESKWKFLTSRKTFSAVMTLLSTALVAISIYEVVKNWSKYEAGHWLLVAQIVVQAFQVAAEVVAIFAVGNLAMVSAFAGPILIIAGLVLMLLAAKYLKVKPEPTDYEKWVKDTGRPFVEKNMPESPKTQLEWSLVQSQLPAEQEATVQLVGKNTSTSDKVELESISMRFFSGYPSSCLFKSSAKDRWKVAGSASDLSSLQVAGGVSDGSAINTIVNSDGMSQGSEADGTFQSAWMVKVSNPNKRLTLTVAPQASITLSLKGTVAIKGKDNEGEEYQFIISEAWVGEKGIIKDTVQEHLKLKKV